MSSSDCQQIAGFAACVGFFFGIAFLPFMRWLLQKL